MKTPVKILETALYCDDLGAAKTFYGEVLGFEMELEVPGRHVFFRLDNSMLLIFNPEATAIANPDAPFPVPPHGAKGEGHVCFAASAEALEEWGKRLKKAGVEIESRITWGNGAKSIYFRDPAGNSLEFAEPKLWNFE